MERSGVLQEIAPHPPQVRDGRWRHQAVFASFSDGAEIGHVPRSWSSFPNAAAAAGCCIHPILTKRWCVMHDWNNIPYATHMSPPVFPLLTLLVTTAVIYNKKLFVTD